MSLVPYVVEQTNRGERSYDIFSRLLNAHIESIPAITANCPDAQQIHEAAIGKIAGDQLLKLETLGLTPEEAEETILKGFLE